MHRAAGLLAQAKVQQLCATCNVCLSGKTSRAGLWTDAFLERQIQPLSTDEEEEEGPGPRPPYN
eukprot:14888204-Heterocapsa_arctica.AAC.1